MATKEQETKFSLRKKYEYLTIPEIDSLYSIAETIYLDRAYPFDKSIEKIPESEKRAFNWIFMCVEEMLRKGECSSAKSYSENGMSITYENAGVSESLLKMIMPKVGTL